MDGDATQQGEPCSVRGLEDMSAAGKDPAAVTQLKNPQLPCAFAVQCNGVGDLQSPNSTVFFYFPPHTQKNQITARQRFRPQSGCLLSQSNYKHGK